MTDERVKDLKHTTGLLLSGGGARAAYQVGVLKAISDILPDSAHNPFGIICGTSAGAINAAGLAMRAEHFRRAVNGIERIWSNFRAEQVYRTDPAGSFLRVAQWFASIIKGTTHPVSLLDNTPLYEYLEELIDFPQIQNAIDSGDLKALAVTASGYTSGHSVTYFQGKNEYDSWRRSRRVGVKTVIHLEHLLASAAIPTIFPAVRIHREYFGDGAIRQLAPISPALHLGSDRVLVIGVSGNQNVAPVRKRVAAYPSLAQIAGHVLNSAFVDALEGDIERVQRINRTLSQIPTEVRENSNIKLRPVGILTISPSQDLAEIANRHQHEFPKTTRFFLWGSGVTKANGSSILSYLLFTRGYCQDLIQLGYRDAIQRGDEIRQFLFGDNVEAFTQ